MEHPTLKSFSIGNGIRSFFPAKNDGFHPSLVREAVVQTVVEIRSRPLSVPLMRAQNVGKSCSILELFLTPPNPETEPIYAIAPSEISLGDWNRKKLDSKVISQLVERLLI